MIFRKNFEVSFQKFYQETPEGSRENSDWKREGEKRGSPDIRDLRNEAERLSKKMEARGTELGKQAERLNGNNKAPNSIDAGEAEKIEKALTENEIKGTLSQLGGGNSPMTFSESTKADIVKSFQEKPFDTTDKTEAEIQAEVEARAIELKVKEIQARELSPAKGQNPAQSEANYIKELEKKYGLSEDSLMAIRARNQTGIGANIDKDSNQIGKIANPEVYKSEMENLAKNAKKAQEYAKANEGLLDAGNSTIAGNVMAILEGKDPTRLSEAEQKIYQGKANLDMQQGEGSSSLGRIAGKGMKGFNSEGGGGNMNLDPNQLANLPPTNPEKAKDLGVLFGSAIKAYGKEYDIPEEWANDPNLHKVVMKESGGIVGRLNYTFGPVAKRMGTNINDPKFITFVHEKLKAGASAGDFGIRSVATGIGQMIKANVIKYYPDQLKGIGNADNESIAMLRYIKDRYGNPANTVAQYGKHHEGY